MSKATKPTHTPAVTPPVVQQVEKLLGATPAALFLSLCLAEAIGTDRMAAILKQVTPDGIDLAATVPGTRRPVSFFADKTRAGLKALGFGEAAVQEVETALLAAGVSVPSGEELTRQEWTGGRTFEGIDWWDLVGMAQEDFEARSNRMPFSIQQELRAIRTAVDRQRQLDRQ